MFPWFSIQNNAWSFEVSESLRMLGTQITEGSRKMKNRMGLSLQHLLRYADEEEYIRMINIMGALLLTRMKVCFSAMETSQFTFNQKV
jgi:hypothetical protein